MRTHLDIKHEGTVGEAGRTRMTLDANATAHLMSVLTDLYSDPMLAAIREYATNAYDSHRAAGNPEPIQVELPTPLRPIYLVRDFGTGMSVTEVQEHFAKYGWSSKRDTDDEVGMLGLGCKSALTYTSQFTLIATKNGIKATVLVTRDSDGCGVVQIMDETSTSQPNGVEVQIPVKHINSFNEAAMRFFAFWEDGTVLVDGKTPMIDETPLGQHETDFVLDPDVVVTSRIQQSVLVMGNVPYPMTSAWAKKVVGTSARNSGMHVMARVPIGSINFTPSREALHYTKRTEEALELLMHFVAGTVRRIAQYEMDVCETPGDALRCAQRWTTHWQFDGGRAARGSRTFGLSELVWRGLRVPLRFSMHHKKPEPWMEDGKPVLDAAGDPIMKPLDESDSRAFTWNWGSGWRTWSRQSNRVTSVSAETALNSLHIVGHKGNGVSKLTKERLSILFELEAALHPEKSRYGNHSVLVYPKAPAGDWFEGLPTLTFDELRKIKVVDDDEPVKRQPPKMYRILRTTGEASNNYCYFEETGTLPKGRVLVWYRYQELADDGNTESLLNSIFSQFPNVVVVRMTQKYETKFLEKHPRAMHLRRWLYAMFRRLETTVTPLEAYIREQGNTVVDQLALRWFANGHRASVLDPDLAFWADAVEMEGTSTLLGNIYRLGQIIQGNVWHISQYDPTLKKNVVIREVKKERTVPARDLLPLVRQVEQLRERYPMLEYLPAYPPVTHVGRDRRKREKSENVWTRRRCQEARRPIEYVNMVYRNLQEQQATQPIPTLGKKGKL